MSVREDNENKNCPSRGLGLAAAAIGVGVGAALYYFFNKRQEPDEGSSSWSYEREHALTEEEQMAIFREMAFRERTWTPEECSICFETMTQTQEVMALPCTHRFHQACILPWLEQRQTCPNCRKTA